MKDLTIIIPAFECDDSIGRSLSSLVRQIGDPLTEIRVIVAVNDGLQSSLDSAEAYRTTLEARGYAFDVILTSRGRREAITAAESLSRKSARLYLDQDAMLSPGAVAAFCRALSDDQSPKFATFRLRFTPSSSRAVQSFIAGWSSLPYFASSPVTAGAFGVSRSGRSRWDTLPPVISDDKFVRLAFAPNERIRISHESYEVLSPQSVGELIKARARYVRMNRELERWRKGPRAKDARRYVGISKLFAKPAQLAAVAFVSLCATFLSLRS